MDADATTVDPLTAINSVQDPNFGVVSASVVNNNQDTNSQDSSSKLGLILGLSIPLGIIRTLSLI